MFKSILGALIAVFSVVGMSSAQAHVRPHHPHYPAVEIRCEVEKHEGDRFSILAKFGTNDHYDEMGDEVIIYGPSEVIVTALNGPYMGMYSNMFPTSVRYTRTEDGVTFHFEKIDPWTRMKKGHMTIEMAAEGNDHVTYDFGDGFNWGEYHNASCARVSR